ncbi:timeless protein-domain-containing protein [Syncephalis fuscata]|nr:timeless protein-domain-containing protein [Syncephalis fuscata]
MSASIETLFLNVCEALGGFESTPDTIGSKNESSIGSCKTQQKGRYVLGDECLDCLRDIKQYLLRDDYTDNKPLLRRVGNTEDQELVCGACLELLVPLTWPPEKTLPWLVERRQHLWDYKYAFIHERILPALFTMLTRWIAVPYTERSGRRQALIRLLITLIRNLLIIEDPHAPSGAFADALKYTQMHTALVKELHSTSFVRLFLVIASSIATQEFTAWNLLLLEVISLLFSQTTSKQLASYRKTELKSNLLLSELDKEERLRNEQKRNAPSRHSRFGGAITERMAYSTAIYTTTIISYGNGVMEEAKDSNGQTMDPDLGKMLYETAEIIIRSCFNLRHAIDVGRQDVLNEDNNRFFSFIAFFLEFQLLTLPDMTNITSDTILFEHSAEALNLRTILCEIKRIQQCRDLKLYSDIVYPVNAFHQTLCMIQIMLQSPNTQHRSAAESLQANIFYEKTILDLMIQLCQIPTARDAAYLIDLVAMIHILLKMLEQYAQERRHVFVRQHRAGKRKRQRKTKDDEDQEDNEEESDHNDEDDNTSDEEENEEDKKKNVSVQITSERQFEFSKFQMSFARESIVQVYCILLEQLPNLDLITVKHILFDKVLDQLSSLENNPVYDALQQFINHCTRRFIKTWQHRSFLAIEIFFPKWNIAISNSSDGTRKKAKIAANNVNQLDTSISAVKFEEPQSEEIAETEEDEWNGLPLA